MKGMIEVKQIDAEDTYPLRQKVMNPELSLQETARPGDETAFHYGAFQKGDLIGVISLYPEDEDGTKTRDVFRIRGMAVDQNWQGRGIGRYLYTESINQLQVRFPIKKIWCNAREGAMEFYQKLGFDKTDEVYIEVPHPGRRGRFVKFIEPDP